MEWMELSPLKKKEACENFFVPVFFSTLKVSVHPSSGMVVILRAENDVDISGYEALPLSLLFIRLDHVDYVTPAQYW